MIAVDPEGEQFVFHRTKELFNYRKIVINEFRFQKRLVLLCAFASFA